MATSQTAKRQASAAPETGTGSQVRTVSQPDTDTNLTMPSVAKVTRAKSFLTLHTYYTTAKAVRDLAVAIMDAAHSRIFDLWNANGQQAWRKGKRLLTFTPLSLTQVDDDAVLALCATVCPADNKPKPTWVKAKNTKTRLIALLVDSEVITQAQADALVTTKSSWRISVK